MQRFILFHGSDAIVDKPEYHYYTNRKLPIKTLDYGEAFYCTLILEDAKEWACKSGYKGIVNKYSIDTRSFKNIIDLTEKNDEESILIWVAILLHYRNNDLSMSFKEKYIKQLDFLENNYFSKVDIEKADIIIGYRADDSYFRFPRDFVEGKITIDTLGKAFRLGKLSKQYAIVSEKAFSKITYISSSEVEDLYIEQYKNKITLANNEYETMEMADQNNISGRFLKNIMAEKNNDKRK